MRISARALHDGDRETSVPPTRSSIVPADFAERAFTRAPVATPLLAALLTSCVAAVTLAPPASAVNVGTLVEVELVKLFEPTGYANTCQGTGDASPIRAGSVFFFGWPWVPNTPIEKPTGTAQMLSSELTDHGTCLIRYVGTAPSPPGIPGLNDPNHILVRYQMRDPFGNVTGTYLGYPQITPMSEPDMPSISQRVHCEMFAGAED